VKYSSFVPAVFVLAILASGCKRSEAATTESRELFTNACSRCHGKDGAGGLPVWTGGPSPRNFNDRDFQVSRTDQQLLETIRNGKPPGMPPFGTTFSDVQLAALVAQVRSFDARAK
jgi:mono/diheme cytochrome c family protein